jgi:hypothetical protein
MRIVKLDEFLRLPEGTIYQKYKPMFFEDLSIKGETSIHTIDFFTTSIPWVESYDTNEMMAVLERAESDPAFSFKLDFETMGRDGLYDKNQLFAIWENMDLWKLVAILKKGMF